MSTALRAVNLSKCFRINSDRPHGYLTLREVVTETFLAPWRHLRNGAAIGRTSEFWALRDLSFDVPAGEVLGVVGRNGAGKSTLLKIIGRITTPTSGRVELFGRVGSLLEVGTGFHPELTGRENILLNGSILGMTRKEINRKFDEIVEFSGVAQFLETPVKRYSSGMRVRLAFAVAAHLDPEILLVDEVLAVGDAEFQRKCLGKMRDVAHSGRTVLFVSHNMAAVQNLCTRVLLLEDGRIVRDGEPGPVVGEYLRSFAAASGTRDLSPPSIERSGTGEARLESVEILTSDGTAAPVIEMGEGIRVRLTIASKVDIPAATVGIGLFDDDGLRICSLQSVEATGFTVDLQAGSKTVVECVVPQMNLMPGVYVLNLLVRRSSSREQLDFVHHAVSFEVVPGNVFSTGRLPRGKSVIFFPSEWSTVQTHDTFQESASLEFDAVDSVANLSEDVPEEDDLTTGSARSGGMA